MSFERPRDPATDPERRMARLLRKPRPDWCPWNDAHTHSFCLVTDDIVKCAQCGYVKDEDVIQSGT